MRGILKSVLLLVIFVVAFIAVVSAIAARAESLRFASPAADSTVTGSIGVIRIGFEEAVDPGLSGLELRNSGGHVVASGVGIGSCDDFSCHLYLGKLDPDDYSVTYNVITLSGKVLNENFTFSVDDAK